MGCVDGSDCDNESLARETMRTGVGAGMTDVANRGAVKFTFARDYLAASG